MNIGFSQNSQLTKNRKRRLEMVNFAEENGISATVKEFKTTYKTVNLWITRYRREGIAGLADRVRQNGQIPEICTNRSKSKLTILKPRNKASYLSAASALPEDEEIKAEPVAIAEKIIPEQPSVSKRQKEIIPVRRLPEVVTPRYANNDSKTIQIGLLNLKETDRFGDLCRRHDLPSWQFTAFDSQSGGAWIAYTYEIDRASQNEFLTAVSKHLVSHGISLNQVKFELCYDAAISDKWGQADTIKTAENPEHRFPGQIVITNGLSEHGSPLNRFHRLLEDKFYSSLSVNSVSKLLKKAESFMLQYNYKENFGAMLNLPPNQLICRQSGDNFDPEILKFKPLVLKKNRTDKARYLVGLRMMAGLFSSLAGSILSRRKRVGITRGIQIAKEANLAKNAKKAKKANEVKRTTKEVSNSLSSRAMIDTAGQTGPTVRVVNNKIEFISLKNMNWEKPREKKAETDTGTVKVRRAKELLAQKRSIAELKSRLPMTEGELSMLSRNMTFSDRERN